MVSVLILICINVTAQNRPNSSMRYINSILKHKGFCEKDLDEYVNYDFTSVFQQEKYDYLGFIGDDYKRFYIKLISVSKDS